MTDQERRDEVISVTLNLMGVFTDFVADVSERKDISPEVVAQAKDWLFRSYVYDAVLLLNIIDEVLKPKEPTP